MSFRGKVVNRKKVMTPLGPGELVTTEFDTPERTKVIWWMGESKVCNLGKLITYYIDKPRKSDSEEIEWEPFFYELELNDNADASEIEDSFFDVESVGEKYEFDDLDKAEEFIDGIKCRLIKMGGINLGSKAEYERWAGISLLELVE